MAVPALRLANPYGGAKESIISAEKSNCDTERAKALAAASKKLYMAKVEWASMAKPRACNKCRNSVFHRASGGERGEHLLT